MLISLHIFDISISDFFVPPQGFEPRLDILEGCCISIYAMEAFLYPQEDSNPYLICRKDKFFHLNYGDNYNLNL